MVSTSRKLASAVVLLALFGAACSDSTAPSAPNPILGLSSAAKSISSVQLTFNSAAGDDSYDIERAEGAAGTFAVLTTLPAPSTPGQVTYVDTNLKVNTLYRYHVITNKGGQKSVASGESTVTTLAFGNASADITTDITTNRTLFADTAYTLKGFIHVANGATLTIQPGTTIKGDFNTLGSSLWILRGAKIQAVGTADAPIVFTSSRAPGSRQPGDWGGLLIIGNAINNRSGSVEVEGSGTDGTAVVGGKNYQVLYSGGTVATDNSGTLSYVRVEFAGFAPSLNNELNSFTFAAVGSGTRASFLQSMAGLDDSYEFFGGALTPITSLHTRQATTCSTCQRDLSDDSPSSSATAPFSLHRGPARDFLPATSKESRMMAALDRDVTMASTRRPSLFRLCPTSHSSAAATYHAWDLAADTA